MAPFTGFPPEAIEFFERLEMDNSKPFWEEHKSTYLSAVRDPMDALLAELEPRFGAGKVFRPYRDVRFSKDKTPYKTNIAATLDHGPYLSLSAAGFAAGSGYYDMAPDQIARYRDAVVDDRSGRALEAVVAKVRKAGPEVQARDALKTAPRGYPKDHPRIELLRYKGVIAWQEWPVEPWLHTPEVAKRVVAFHQQVAPLLAWLDDHVGPSRS